MAVEGFDHDLTTKFEFLSKYFTTDWDELPLARAS